MLSEEQKSDRYGVKLFADVTIPPATCGVKRRIYPGRAHHVRVANILAVHAKSDPHDAGWYYRAATWVQHTADVYSVPTATVAGVLAALSPAVEWGRNMVEAEIMIARTNESFRYSTYQANVTKAKRILAGEPPWKVLGGNKVRSFYLAIMEPWRRDVVVVDRHALSAALGRKATPDEQQELSKRARRYRDIAADYMMAAREVGETASQVQARVWSAWRAMFGRTAQ